MFDDNWATSHLNSMGIFSVIALGGILIWALILKNQEDSRTLLQTEEVFATIIEINKFESKTDGYSRFGAGGITTYVVQLELLNKKRIEFRLSNKPPKTGTKVPVSISVYDNGENYYNYNRVEWGLLM